MDDSTAHDESQVLTDIPRVTPAPVYEPEVMTPPRPRPSGVTRTHVALFLLTLTLAKLRGRLTPAADRYSRSALTAPLEAAPARITAKLWHAVQLSKSEALQPRAGF